MKLFQEDMLFSGEQGIVLSAIDDDVASVSLSVQLHPHAELICVARGYFRQYSQHFFRSICPLSV